MNILSKHIESLLTKHNCVIVPDLGGFVAGYVSAVYQKEGKTFFPPKRTIGFNPSLTLNDGLLVQSYMYAYDISFPEATAMIEDTVSKLKRELQSVGEVSLGKIGKIVAGVDGRCEFINSEAGILSPELYALDAYQLSQVSNTATATTSNSDETKDSKTTYTLRINKKIVNFAAAAVLTVFFYILWATPLATNQHANVASIIPSPKKEVVKEDNTAFVQKTTSADMANNQVSQPNESANSDDIAFVCPEDGFTIVLVSKVSLKNAYDFTQLLKSEGLDGAQVFKKGKMTRVIYNTYKTSEEAYAQLSELKQQSKHFAYAWVLEL